MHAVPPARYQEIFVCRCSANKNCLTNSRANKSAPNSINPNGLIRPYQANRENGNTKANTAMLTCESCVSDFKTPAATMHMRKISPRFSKKKYRYWSPKSFKSGVTVHTNAGRHFPIPRSFTQPITDDAYPSSIPDALSSMKSSPAKYLGMPFTRT